LAALALAGAPLAHAADPKPAEAKPAAAAQKPAEKIDINSATAEELAQLKGIGPARAEAIVKGRPYKGKDDLPRRKIIPQSVYDQIKDDIIAKQK
ncbi:MAG TPA: helix-hairpin-helix domain-containing protein, partial [Quisquiliibacterium sp.]|nr:helix-hairpin-helix domain-containing protein [Quisquiliibacterium sp.]